MIAMGLMGSPQLMIADEPTTALDVTLQRQILELLREVRDEQGTAIVFISHDVAVVSPLCQRVLVMYADRVIADLPTSALQNSAAHPYTAALLDAVPNTEGISTVRPA
jgi:peptide/nickel transport system permease protein